MLDVVYLTSTTLKMNRQAFHYIVITAALCLISLTGFAQQTYTFVHDSIEREYILYLPEDLPAEAPLVFVMHGYTGSAQGSMNGYQMNPVADEHKFAVCYPQGAQDLLGVAHWNANLAISTIDDIGFLTELAFFLQAEYDLSVEHTFACGMSNGGFMSYTLACERPDVFSAIASVTGTMSGYDWLNCDPANPVPVMQIAGTADNVVPIDGSMTTFGGWGGAPGLDSVVAFWVERNMCNDIADATIEADHTTTVTYYQNGVNDHEVRKYLIDGWGHRWPTSNIETGFTASEEIWDFFSQYTSGTSSIEALAVSEEIIVFPNPGSSMVTVRRNRGELASFKLFSPDGKMVSAGVISGTEDQLDISRAPDGLLILQIGQQRIKLVKQG